MNNFSEQDKPLPIIPGRGLVTPYSTQLRLQYLQAHAIPSAEIANSAMDMTVLQKNIESFIGSVEIPLGIVGPLLFKDGGEDELVYTAAGTLEGALVASMNRGAKAISLSGGFTAEVLWQKMTRAPLFIFEKEEQVPVFEDFVKTHFAEIKQKAESYSNHAKLLELNCVAFDNVVHVKFTYSTGDASGQNMTTTCTWHAMLFMVDLFVELTGIRPTDWILEGNGSSDKKVSTYSTTNGRGVNVTAECFLSEKVLNEVLRTSSHKMMQAFGPSQKLAQMDGMVGYNINVANAVAAIFVATGQDLACIHESSVGLLQLKESNGGLHLKLQLPNLVIGTVGGGTHLRKQSEGLHILKCAGVGKVNRFAKLIAGFAMGLEISTYAAIVSGEFAKAHEKLGRNKPVDWLLPNELKGDFLKNCLTHFHHPVLSIEPRKNEVLENGILTHIAKRVSQKVLGFTSLELVYQNEQGNGVERKLLLKSKALDDEVIKGLHAIAASIDPALSDLIKTHRHVLEYEKCHLKEQEMYTFLSKHGFKQIPDFYGSYTNPKREIYLLVMEELENLLLFNAENTPEKWSPDLIRKVIQTAHTFHQLEQNEDIQVNCNQEFKPWEANELYNKLVALLVAEESNAKRKNQLQRLTDAALRLKELSKQITVSKTIVHNDFNPRNVGVRRSGEIVIYDWELAVKNYPHRDIVEWLCFVLPEQYSHEELMSYLEEHYQLSGSNNRDNWFLTYQYAITEFIITRALFYEVAGIVVKYDFSTRVLNNALRMQQILANNG